MDLSRIDTNLRLSEARMWASDASQDDDVDLKVSV